MLFRWAFAIVIFASLVRAAENTPRLTRTTLVAAAVESATDGIGSGWCGRGMLSILKKSGLGQAWLEATVRIGNSFLTRRDGRRFAALRRCALHWEACLSISATQGSENACAERQEGASAMSRWLPLAWAASGSTSPTARVPYRAERFLIISPGERGFHRAGTFGDHLP